MLNGGVHEKNAVSEEVDTNCGSGILHLCDTTKKIEIRAIWTR